jgi:glycosyltransferase involved in cell wall biosynthesis
MTPDVSVIIPVYNGADYLGPTIESVLAQTHREFELVVVDDASPDESETVVKRYRDYRIKYIRHTSNRGANAARNTGIRAASGRLLAFLDQDDLFHSEKLAVHLAFRNGGAEPIVTYNARFDLDYSADTIAAMWWPPSELSLSDLVTGFLLAPSDVVVERETVLRGGHEWPEDIFHGGEYLFFGKLALAGQTFRSVERVLNYRRYHTGRVIGQLRVACESEVRAQEEVLKLLPPTESARFRPYALANTYLTWTYFAFLQGDTLAGQQFLRLAQKYDPAVVAGRPSELVRLFVRQTIADANLDHELVLRRLLEQVPAEMRPHEELLWAVRQAALAKAIQAVIWKGWVAAEPMIARASILSAVPDERLLRETVHQLLTYEQEFGQEKCAVVLEELTSALDELGCGKASRWLRGCYAVNRAFNHYNAERWRGVPPAVVQAVGNDPHYLANRGVLAILFRSLIGIMRR